MVLHVLLARFTETVLTAHFVCSLGMVFTMGILGCHLK